MMTTTSKNFEKSLREAKALLRATSSKARLRAKYKLKLFKHSEKEFRRNIRYINKLLRD